MTAMIFTEFNEAFYLFLLIIVVFNFFVLLFTYCIYRIRGKLNSSIFMLPYCIAGASLGLILAAIITILLL